MMNTVSYKKMREVLYEKEVANLSLMTDQEVYAKTLEYFKMAQDNVTGEYFLVDKGVFYYDINERIV